MSTYKDRLQTVHWHVTQNRREVQDFILKPKTFLPLSL